MRLGILLVVTALLVACGPKTKKLSDVEKDHYYALKVWMDKDLDKAFFKYKTEDERNAFLKDAGLWERFYKYDADTRQAIVDGEVAVGWGEDAVFMSWGNPIKRLRATGRPAARSEVFTYRFEITKDGSIMIWKPKSDTAYKAVHQYEVDVYVDDSVVAELVQRDKW